MSSVVGFVTLTCNGSTFCKLAPYDFWFKDAGFIEICWFEVKTIEELSLFTSSIICTHPLLSALSGWPFLIIVIGSPLSSSFLSLDQVFNKYSSLTFVEPNLIEFPNLPSTIKSPGK